ncbi:MAG TPA: hypothetical protein VGA94_04425, partial [Thermodesulfobacteriota bacterium]
YQQSCVNLKLKNNGWTMGCDLEAQCRRGTTQPYDTVSRVAIPCSGDIANCIGVLTCGSC